jgi:hypothetical protein
LENVALRFSHAIEEGALDLKSGCERGFLLAVLVKTVNEMFATIGSLRHGALTACYHHPRSILELLVALEYVYCKPSKRERRLEKFIAYADVAKYRLFRDWQRRLSNGEVTKDQFAQACPVSQHQFEELRARLPEWCRIWNLKENDCDPESINNWHYPATIKNLFECSDKTRDLWEDYEMLCHLAHLSPLGDGVTGVRCLIGFPRYDEASDYQIVNLPIDLTILATQRIVLCLEERVKAGVIQGVLEWVPGDP